MFKILFIDFRKAPINNRLFFCRKTTATYYKFKHTHDKEFDMCVNIDDVVKGYGTGKNKKQAEQQAARDALIKSIAI